ncbi:protein gdap2 homolog [Phtheirospermum japonicum]|uniref:Protein gdap2 homolog n=1 Tax=Phtheirospermum japonicum TaxID=374723 RepID=A0A830BNT8_9LAMI|nr:protein gdap2 homolog [Phtheirospermum japonicum]
MYRAGAATPNRGGFPTDSVDSVVTLDQVPRWSDSEFRYSYENEDSSFHNPLDPLASASDGENSGNGMVSRFPVDHEINSKIYLWRGNPWNLEVDAVVNSTNENLDEAHSSPGLHAAAGPGLAEECATLGGCRTGMAKVTSAYDLPARRVIHTVGPKYAVKYHTAAENALSHCYRSCLELLIDNGLRSIATGCIYTEAKNYPREPAAHVAIRTVRRFLEKQKDKIDAVVFCTITASDTEIYKRLLPLYFPRDKLEEEMALSKLPADVGDENGETVIDERKIRIKPLPNLKKTVQRSPQTSSDLQVSDIGVARKNSSYLESYLDPAFMSLIKDPDQRRREQWEKSAQARKSWNFAKMFGYGDLGGPPLSAAEEYSLHSRYLAKANSLNLSDIAEMKIVYRGGVDSEGRPVMVVVGAHFLLRCLDLERFVLQPDLGWMKRLEQILGRKHQRNLHAIYVLHPTFGLKAAIFAMQLVVDDMVWKKVVYVDRLLQLFRYVPREQLTIPDFVFQHDLEVNGGKGVIMDPRTKYVYQRP